MNNVPSANSVGVSKSLDSWRNPSPAYTPLSNVSFGPLEFVTPHWVPQMPDPTGILGGIQPVFNKLADFPNVLEIEHAKPARQF